MAQSNLHHSWVSKKISLFPKVDREEKLEERLGKIKKEGEMNEKARFVQYLFIDD